MLTTCDGNAAGGKRRKEKLPGACFDVEIKK